MRRLLLALGIVAGAAMNCGAQAQNYPWCAVYGGGDKGGATNCGFTSFEQCMATLRGMGGFCNQNTQYTPPAAPHHVPVHRRRRH
jgi:Protein of unknown function (DUF3551)